MGQLAKVDALPRGEEICQRYAEMKMRTNEGLLWVTLKLFHMSVSRFSSLLPGEVETLIDGQKYVSPRAIDEAEGNPYFPA